MQDKFRHRQGTQGHHGEQEIKELFHQLFPGESQAETQSHRGIGVYLQIINRHKWIVITALLVIPLLTIAWLILERPSYQATATLLIEPSNPKIVEFEEVVQPDRSREYIQTQYELIKSFDLLGEVVDNLDAQDNTTSSVSDATMSLIDKLTKKIKYLSDRLQYYKSYYGLSGDYPVQDFAELERYNKITELFESIQVEPVRNTRLVNVTVQGQDPNAITNQVNTLTRLFVSKNLKDKREASANASQWLKNEVENLRQQMHEAELELLAFVEQRGYKPQNQSGSNGSTATTLAGALSLESAINDIKAEKINLEYKKIKLEHLLALFSKKNFLAVSNVELPAVQSLQEEYLTLKQQALSLRQTYHPKHPKVQTILNEQESIGRKIIQNTRNELERVTLEYNDVLQKEQATEKLLADEKENLAEHDKDTMAYRALQLNVNNKRDLYEKMVNRLSETEVTTGLQSNNIKISQKAIVPVIPIPSNKKAKLLAGIAISLALGIGGAILIERFNQSFYSSDEVEQHMGASLLGIIPHQKRTQSKTYSPSSSNSPSYEKVTQSYRLLRTNILFRASNHSTQFLLVTSTNPKEGKSTISINLGLSFAQLGKSVLLIDANWQHPSLHKILNLENSQGLSDILSGGSSWEQAIQHTSIENLKIITSGPHPSNAIEFLMMTKISTLCQQWENPFDMVIFDSPALLGIHEAAVLAAEQLDVLIVYDPDVSKRQSLLKTKKILQDIQANVVGIIINNVKNRSHFNRFELHPQKLPEITSQAQSHLPTLSQSRVISGLPPDLLASPRYHSNPDSHLVISIHKLQYHANLDNMMNNDEKHLLIIDIDVFNNLDEYYIFESSLATLYCNDTNAHQTSVTVVYDTSEDTIDQVNFNHLYHPLLDSDLGSLKEKEVINPHSSIRGTLMYRVHTKTRNYTFVYEQHEIHISIPLVAPYLA